MAVRDQEVAFLGQEAIVAQGVDFGLAVAVLVQQGLGEDVVHLKPVHHAEGVGVEGETVTEVPGATHAGQEVKQRVEPGTSTPAGEVVRFNAQSAPPDAQLVEEGIDATLGILKRRQILVDIRLG